MQWGTGKVGGDDSLFYTELLVNYWDTFSGNASDSHYLHMQPHLGTFLSWALKVESVIDGAEDNPAGGGIATLTAAKSLNKRELGHTGIA